jgi:hypothetical protein
MSVRVPCPAEAPAFQTLRKSPVAQTLLSVRLTCRRQNQHMWKPKGRRKPIQSRAPRAAPFVFKGAVFDFAHPLVSSLCLYPAILFQTRHLY